MTNKDLLALIDEFIEKEDDTNKDEWYGTNKEFAESVMMDFTLFLKEKGKRI